MRWHPDRSGLLLPERELLRCDGADFRPPSSCDVHGLGPVVISGSGNDDPYGAYVVALLHCEGANGGTTFTDERGHTFGRQYSALTTVTSDFKAGTASINFPGTDFLTSADNADWEFAAGDFTIELFAKASSYAGSIFNKRAGTGTAAFSVQSETLYMSSNGATYDIASAVSLGTFTTGSWIHLALSRSGSNIRFFMNGALAATVSSASAITNNAGALQFGGTDNGGSITDAFTGKMDEIRVTKGVARYTAAFTPPTAPFAYP